MFERFTDRARRVVVLAQEHAREMNHHYIGTEHVLLGLIAEGGGVAARVLKELDVSVESVRHEVEQRIGRGATEVTRKHIPFTPRAKRILELSLREALQLGHNYIGTEHILLGLIREGEGVAATVLVGRGLDLLSVRGRIVALLQGYTSAETAEAAGGGVSARLSEVAERAGAELLSGLRARREPACPSCHAALEGSVAYRIVEVPEDGGDGKAQVLFVYCRACGHTIDDLILPDEG